MSADHIPDHNALWGTWKHRIQDRQRALFPEQKPLYVAVWNYYQTILSLWEQDVGGSSPFTPTSMSVHNVFMLWTLFFIFGLFFGFGFTKPMLAIALDN